MVQKGLAAPISASDTTSKPRLRIPDDIAVRFSIAQLLGMRDDLTERVSKRVESGLPIVLKYAHPCYSYQNCTDLLFMVSLRLEL